MRYKLDAVEKAIKAGYVHLERTQRPHMEQDTLFGGVVRAYAVNKSFELAIYKEKRRAMANDMPASQVSIVGATILGAMLAFVVRNMYEPKDQQAALYSMLNHIGEVAVKSVNAAGPAAQTGPIPPAEGTA